MKVKYLYMTPELDDCWCLQVLCSILALTQFLPGGGSCYELCDVSLIFLFSFTFIPLIRHVTEYSFALLISLFFRFTYTLSNTAFLLVSLLRCFNVALFT